MSLVQRESRQQAPEAEELKSYTSRPVIVETSSSITQQAGLLLTGTKHTQSWARDKFLALRQRTTRQCNLASLT